MHPKDADSIANSEIQGPKLLIHSKDFDQLTWQMANRYQILLSSIPPPPHHVQLMPAIFVSRRPVVFVFSMHRTSTENM